MVSILLPLYIYPTAGSWEPLLSVAQSHPGISFTVVVNPNNGPGTTPLPDDNYVEALASFKSLPNVHLIGYVCCYYGDRDTDLIEDDIYIYSQWESELATLGQTGVSVDGIFFDEVPAEVEYGGSTVIFNPGVIVDEAFYSQADLVVAFEDTELNLDDFLEASDDLSAQNRAKSAAIVHTYQGTAEGLADLVDEIREAGLGGVFVTDQTGGVYNEWPDWWDSLIEIVRVFPDTVATKLKTLK
ncbi:unnamed protein product [Parascedosporium putredinis]|uniref:Spherulation-specific family 4 n=1 Tax=Parascedosporium putredinis TaxID=1442378 RepID=A0A9P1H021_9PEZI|nr:unnamed protein product [Parascedosporium putredinis]CAI7992370.1 unnamed protein product [Parascedosporium putredinis]